MVFRNDIVAPFSRITNKNLWMKWNIDFMASCIWDIINHLNPQVKGIVPAGFICRVLVDQQQYPLVVKKAIRSLNVWVCVFIYILPLLWSSRVINVYLADNEGNILRLKRFCSYPQSNTAFHRHHFRNWIPGQSSPYRQTVAGGWCMYGIWNEYHHHRSQNRNSTDPKNCNRRQLMKQLITTCV